MSTSNFTLREARLWARRVGATIEEVRGKPEAQPPHPPFYRVRLGVPVIGSSGTRSYPILTAPDPYNAANLAIVETAKAAAALASHAKEVYVSGDFLLGGPAQ